MVSIKSRFAVSLAFGIEGFLVEQLMRLLPIMRDEQHFSNQQFQILLLMFSLIAAVGCGWAEITSKKYPSRLILQIGISTIAISFLLIAINHQPGLLYILIIFYSLGVGMIDASVNMQGAAIQRLYDRPIINSIFGFWTLGALVGMLYTAACQSNSINLSLKSTMLTSGAISIVLVIIIFNNFLNDKPIDSKIKLVARQIPKLPFWVLGTVIFLFFTVDYAISTSTHDFMSNTLHSSNAFISFSLAFYRVGSLVGRMYGDRLVERISLMSTFLTSAIVGTLAFGLFVISNQQYLSLAALGVVGLAFSILAPICFSSAAQLVPMEYVNKLMARLNWFGYTGIAAGGALIAWIISQTTQHVSGSLGYRLGFGVAAIFSTLIILLVIFYRKLKSNNSEDRLNI